MTRWAGKGAAILKHVLPLFVVIGAAVVVSLPFLSTQLIGTHDLDVHQERLVEFYENIRRGIVLPIWSENAAGGIGRPAFVFVAPLPYYVGSIFLALGTSSVVALQLSLMLGAMTAATAMYSWGKLVVDRWFGVLAAAVLLTSDYFVFDYLERGALAECLAWGPFIWVLYFCERYRRQRLNRHIVWASLWFSALVLVHNLTIIMAGPIVALYLAWVLWWLPKPRIQHALRLAIVPVSGLLNTAFFWLPAAYYRNTIHLERPIGGFGEYTRHIVPFSRLTHVHWFFSPGDELNVIGPLFLGGAIVVLTRKSAPRYVASWLRWCLSLAVMAMAMTLPVSLPVWRHLPFLAFLQFPWRWLMIGTIFGSVTIASALRELPLQRRWLGTALVACVLAIGLGFAYAFGQAAPKATHANTTAANIRLGCRHLDHDDAFQPKWGPSTCGAIDANNFVSMTQGQGTYSAIIRHNYREVLFNNPGPVHVKLATAYYPTWQVMSPGGRVIAPRSGGLIELDLPKGSVRLVLEQKATSLMLAARLLSTLALLALVAGVWAANQSGGRHPAPLGTAGG